MFFSQTFISFLGGDALRIWRVRRLGLPLTEATSAIVFDRLTGILVNHLFLLASTPWLLTVVDQQPIRIAIIFLALAGIGGFTLIFLLGFLRGRGGLLHSLRTRIAIKRIAILLVEASTVGRYFLGEYRQLAGIVLVSIWVAVANILFFAIILWGMGIDLSLAVACAVLVPAILEIAMLPISIAGWGVREGATVVAFGALGLPAHQAIGSSVAFGLMVAGVSLLGGVWWLADRREMALISHSVSGEIKP
jgi:hypothetical protein